MYSAQSGFQTKLTALIESYKAECDRMQGESAQPTRDCAEVRIKGRRVPHNASVSTSSFELSSIGSCLRRWDDPDRASWIPRHYATSRSNP